MRNDRNQSLDLFRGIAIMCMIAANFTADIEWVPFWGKHASGFGLHFVDLIAPMFVFVIGATLRSSFTKRAALVGLKNAYKQKASAACMLIGIGTLLSAGDALVRGGEIEWGVLQTLGVVQLFVLVFLIVPIRLRILIAIVVVTTYQLSLDIPEVSSMVYLGGHGGLYGALAWGSMGLLADGLHEAHTQAKNLWYRLCILGLVAAGVAVASLLSPIAKRYITMSYVFFSLFFCYVLFLGVERLAAHIRLPSVSRWGRHSLFLYCSHLTLMAIFVLPSDRGWFVEAPWWLSCAQFGALALILDGAVQLIERGHDQVDSVGRTAKL